MNAASHPTTPKHISMGQRTHCRKPAAVSPQDTRPDAEPRCYDHAPRMGEDQPSVAVPNCRNFAIVVFGRRGGRRKSVSQICVAIATKLELTDRSQGARRGSSGRVHRSITVAEGREQAGRCGVCCDANEDNPMRNITDHAVTTTVTDKRDARLAAAWRLAASAGVISLMLGATAGAALAAKPGGGGGGHPGGGGGHPGGGGGGAHFGGGAPHFSARAAAPHFSAPRAHFSAPHVAHFSRPSFHAHAMGGSHFNHANNGSIGHAQVTPSHVTPLAVHPLATGAHPFAAGVHPAARA